MQKETSFAEFYYVPAIYSKKIKNTMAMLLY